MNKVIRITMPDSSIWDVPADIVATHRALFYANMNSNGDDLLFREIFREEFDSIYQDDIELINWAQNYMSWNDVEHAAERIDYMGDMDYDSGWKTGPMVVIDIDIDIDKDEIEEV